MAINTQKLLPSAKGGALVKFNAGAIAPSLSIKRKSIDVNKLALISQKRNEQNVSIVQRSLINVDTLLRTIYSEYKQKGLLPKNFPVKTLREVITIAKSLDNILEREIFDQKVDMKIFNGIKEFEKIVQDFESAVVQWGKKYLSNDSYTDATSKIKYYY